MDTASSLPAELRTYLATCSTEHADEIIHTLRNTNAPLTMIVQPGSRVGKAKAVKKQRIKNAKSKAVGVSGGPKRPLNSWMAFRKYYNASLSPLTQKAISKVLMSWWHEDPFSAKWAILAKAYSVLRGSREKDEAPLDQFLELAVPLMGIVPPAAYPALMGWQVTAPGEADQDKSPRVTRLFTPDFTLFDDKYTTTTLSVDDLVVYAMRAGYLNDGDTKASANDSLGALTMAVQPATTTPSATFAALHLQTTIAEDGTIDMPLSPFSIDLSNQLTDELHRVANAPPATNDLTATTVAITNAGSYPYTNLFDPTSQFNVSFNPNAAAPGLEDGGLYDAFDPVANMSVDDMLALDWSQFVNDDGTA
ncbi:hypothetical protein LTR53_006270 [Teratosphaeriaceae sp. CCFEE 6253]|nr:hypothetical protein LTR53_006270 [Teratosphaeriaceae sp. CCFEE 6253]